MNDKKTVLLYKLHLAIEALTKIGPTPKYGGDQCSIDWEWVAHHMEEIAIEALKKIEDIK